MDKNQLESRRTNNVVGKYIYLNKDENGIVVHPVVRPPYPICCYFVEPTILNQFFRTILSFSNARISNRLQTFMCLNYSKYLYSTMENICYNVSRKTKKEANANGLKENSVRFHPF